MDRDTPRLAPIWAQILLAVSLIASLCGPAPAQPPAPYATAPAEAAGTPGPRRLVELGPGDTVGIQVYGQPDMTTTVPIGDDGMLPVALIGAINVAGLSPAEASRKIEDALRAGNFLVAPHVTLTVVQSRSQRVSVLGEVKNPGRYVTDAGTTVFDLLAQAGGTTPDAGDTAYILRPKPDGSVERFAIRLRGGMEGQSQSATQLLQSGDSLLVPKSEQFSIYGEVTKPDIYRLEPGMTVIQAIVRAGGITPRGSERRVEIKRLQPNGSYKTFGAKPGDAVQPGDVLRVKESIF